MDEPQRTRNFARAERKFDLMGELGTDLLLICSNVSPASQGGIDRAAADFRAARRARRHARPARWLRGAGLGSPCQRLSRRLGNRAPRRPRFDRDHSRQFSCAGAVVSGRADQVDTGGQDLPGPARGRPETRPRCAVLEPAFPLLSGTGRSAGHGFHGSRAAPPAMRARWSLEIFNDQFRSGSAVRTATDGLRSLILLEDQLAQSAPECAGDEAAAQSAEPRRRVHRVRHQRGQVRRSDRAVADSSAFAGPVPIAARTSSAGRRATSNSSSIASRMALPIRITSPTAPASAPSRSMSTTPAKP